MAPVKLPDEPGRAGGDPRRPGAPSTADRSTSEDDALDDALQRRQTLLRRASVALFAVAAALVIVAILGATVGRKHHTAATSATQPGAGAGFAQGPAGGSSGNGGTAGGSGSGGSLGAVADFGGTALTTGPFKGFSEVAATLVSASGATEQPCLLAATDEPHREQGLMTVTDPTLDGHGGMVFVFPASQQEPFWMRNTPTPLAIAFYDASGRFVSSTDMAPCGDSASCPNYHAAAAYTMAVEVPQGQPLAQAFGPGSTLRLGGACKAPTGSSSP